MPRLNRWEELKKILWRSGSRGKARPLCAGSGLERARGGFWAVGDDLNHVVRVPDGPETAHGHRIFPGDLPADAARRKKLKRDLETLVDIGQGRLLAIPSGSKRRRGRGALIRLDACGRFKDSREVDFRPLLAILEKSIEDLNIEGAYVRGSRLVLLQRGNGKAGFNGLVKADLKAVVDGLGGRWRASALKLKIKRKPLGSWSGVPLGFTDGFFHDGVAYFSASAEGGKDTYQDGRIFGSVVGALRKGMRPLIFARLASEKIEGLALRSESDGLLELCAITDNDDPGVPSRLLRIWIKKPDF